MPKQNKNNFCFNFVMAFLTALIWGLSATANDFNFEVPKYKDAENNKTFIRFDMKSTKFGLVTTSFTGFVKKFSAHADVAENELKNVKLDFMAEALDTDVGGRNDKMLDLCLDAKKHPQINVQLEKSIPLTGETLAIPAKLNLRGYEKPITVSAFAKKTDSGYTVDGETELSIKELEIPDPSIAIASVKDQIKVKFHFEVPQ